MATGDTQDILVRLKAALPSGWFGNTTPILDAVLTGFASALAWLYSLYQYALLQTRIATATGAWLDVIAADFFGTGLPRLANELDPQYRARIRAALLIEQGTRNAIYITLLRLTGRAPVIFEPARPADTGAYTATLTSFANRWANPLLYRGNAPAAASKSLTLDTNANTTADYYANAALRIVAGTGAGQERKGITSRKNLLSYSQAFDNAAWAKFGATSVTANTNVAPDGTLTADTINDIDNTDTLIYQSTVAVIASGAQLLASIYIKQGTSTTSTFNMINGAVGEVNSTVTWIGGLPYLSNPVNCTHSILDVGNGWYRWSVLFTMAATSACTFRFWPTVRNTPALMGTAIVWGAQLEIGSSATEYIRTEANAAIGVAVDRPWSNNLLLYSQAFDNAYYSTAATVTPNSDIAPDGSLTADNLSDTSNTQWLGTTKQLSAGSAVQNASYCLSIFIKKDAIGRATRFPLLRIGFQDGAGYSSAGLSIDTSAGQFVTGATLTAVIDGAGVVDFGTYWRAWISGHDTSATTSILQMEFYPAVGASAAWSQSASTTGSCTIWGVQLEVGTSPSPYAATGAFPILPPDATSVYDLSPNVYSTAWPTNASGLGYGATGGYGSLSMAYQALVKAYLPATAGIPYVASYSSGGTYPSLPAGASYAAYTTPSRTEYALLANAQNNAGMNSVYQAVAAAKPAGTIVWVGTGQ